jgi:hypothetical protein
MYANIENQNWDGLHKSVPLNILKQARYRKGATATSTFSSTIFIPQEKHPISARQSTKGPNKHSN